MVNAARGPRCWRSSPLWTIFPIYYIVSPRHHPVERPVPPGLLRQHPTLDNFKFVHLPGEPVREVLLALARQQPLGVGGDHGARSSSVAAMGSFALGRIRFGLGRWVSGITLFTYIIPASFLSIPFFKIMGDYDLLDTYWALIFAMTTFAAPYALWVLWDYAKTIPQEIDESAAIDGAGLLADLLPHLPAPHHPVAHRHRRPMPSSTRGTSTSTRCSSSRARRPSRCPWAWATSSPRDDAPWNLLMALSVIYVDPARALLLRLPPLPDPRPRIGRGAGDLIFARLAFGCTSPGHHLLRSAARLRLHLARPLRQSLP